MNRLGKGILSSVFASVAAMSLAACGGGSQSALPQPLAPAATATPATSAGTLAQATLKITIPVPSSTSGAARRPAYVSPSTLSIKVALSSPPTGYVQPSPFNVTLGSGNCPGSGPWTCTLTINIPPGSDTVTFTAYDATNGTGNILAQQVKTFAVNVGVANSFSFVFDAQAGGVSACPNPSIVVTPGIGVVGTQCVGATVGTLYFSGTSALAPFAVAVKDAGGNIIGPGAPGAPVIGASTTGGIIGTTTPSSNPSRVSLTPNGTAGAGTLTVTASGLGSPTDGITQRSVTLNIQEDAQVGTAACPATPSIHISPPTSGATGSDCNGASQGSFTLNGSGALVFPVTLKDAGGTTIAPGSGPTLTVATGGTIIATVTPSSNPYQLTITPNGTFGTGTVTVTATSAHPGDGIVDRTITFSIVTVPTLFAVGGANTGNTGSQIDILTYNTTLPCGATPAPCIANYGTVPTSALGTLGASSLGFDTSNNLYAFDSNANQIFIISGAQLNQSSGQTHISLTDDINSSPVSGAFSSFALAPDGTMAVANPFGDKDQIVAFAPPHAAGQAHTLGLNFPALAGATCSAGPCGTPAQYRAYAPAVLRTTGGVFAYAAAMGADNGGAEDLTTTTDFASAKIGIMAPANTIGGSSATCSGAPTSCFSKVITNEVGATPIGFISLSLIGLAWDAADQDLIFIDPNTGNVVQYAYSGSTFGAGTLIGSFTAPAVTGSTYAYAISRTGYIALAYFDGTNSHLAVWNNVRTQVQNKVFAGAVTVAALAWVPDVTMTGGNAIILAGGLNDDSAFVYNPTTGALITSKVLSDLAPGGLTAGGSSGQSARRRPMTHRTGPWRQ
jgi:hypothetical protein